LSLTRRRRKQAWRSVRVVGRSASFDRQRVIGRDRGRQRLRYQLGLRLKTPRPRVIRRRGCRSQHPPGPSGVSSHVFSKGSGPTRSCSTMGSESRSWRVAVKRSSTWVARGFGYERARRIGFRPGEMGGAQKKAARPTEGARGSRSIRRVLVSLVDCRHRGDASSPYPRR
jgi:hypothetical protein